MKQYWSIISGIAVISVSLACAPGGGPDTPAPYPMSRVIESITWDFADLVRLAPGSDLWPITWGADDNLYTSWGDGVGFGAIDFKEQWGPSRASLGFSRIEGPPSNFEASNVWGGKNAENPAKFTGKASGMLAANSILYAWANAPQRPNVPMRLLWSTDRGRSWNMGDWRFGESDTLRDISFLNFGKNYQGARDNYVYSYALERGGSSDPVDLFFTEIHLLRVPKVHSSMIDRTAYEFFAGLEDKGSPIWTRNIAERRAVFRDPNGVGIPSVVYSPGIERYILTTAHGPNADGVRKLGVFDAPEPWGPWTTVEYNDDWGGFTGYWLGYYIPTKTPGWMSPDGLTIHLVFSGQRELDSFNLVKGTLILKTVVNGTSPGVPSRSKVRQTLSQSSSASN